MTSAISSSNIADTTSMDNQDDITSMEEVEEFSCNSCNNTFKLRRALMMHMRKNHNQQGSNGSLEESVEEKPNTERRRQRD